MVCKASDLIQIWFILNNKSVWNQIMEVSLLVNLCTKSSEKYKKQLKVILFKNEVLHSKLQPALHIRKC